MAEAQLGDRVGMSAPEFEIEKQVYRLYALTKDEIGMVGRRIMIGHSEGRALS
jgi:hypothetical protein